MISFSRKEVQTLILAALVLGLLFGYDDGQPTFQPSYWTTNLILMVFLSFIALLFYDCGHKYVAQRLGCDAHLDLWKGRRFGFSQTAELRRPIKAIPLGIIVPFILIFLTHGLVRWAAITTTHITSTPAKRLGREFARIPEFDEARIALAGPMTALLFALIAKLLAPIIPSASHFMNISLYLALFNLIPLPTLDGLKVYFGSPLLFSFSAVFVVAIFFLIHLLSPVITILLAVLAAVITFFLHWHYTFVKS